MARRLFLILFSAMMGITFVPDMLASADSFVATRIDFNEVETVLPPEPEPELEPVSRPELEPEATAVVATAPQIVNYTVTIQVSSRAEYVNLASNLSYGDIYRYQRMIYGHNSSGLLGSLAWRYVGEIIQVTEFGVAKNYRVADIRLYERTADGRLNGEKGLMDAIANSALGHSLALLTCAGVPDGNGGASHRLVVFVDEV